MRKIVVLFSGGVESSALLVHYLTRNYLVYPLYVKFGYPWEWEELKKAKGVYNFFKARYPNLMLMGIRKFKAVLKKFQETPESEKELEIPMRNFILCTVGAVYALSKGINRCAIGSLGIYPFEDNKREFFEDFSKTISASLGKEFFVETPFMNMHKHEVIRKYGRLIPLELSLTCISPVGGKPCGKCIKCKEREEALSLL